MYIPHLKAIIIAFAAHLSGKDAEVINKSSQNSSLATSPPFYPSPWLDSQATGWEEAYVQAREFVGQLTLLEKVNLTTGVGWEGEQCVGQVCVEFLTRF